MAVRHATKRYPRLADFMADYESTIRRGALGLAPAELDGDPAPELRVDLVLPVVGRLGPLPAQVVSRAPDGSVGLRLPEIPADVQKGFQRLLGVVEDVREFLVASGELVPRVDVERMLEAAGRDPAASGAGPGGGAAPARRAHRGFEVPDVAGVSPLAQGLLGNRSMRDTLVRLAVLRTTGLLVVVSNDGTQHFGFWYQGGPVGWRTEPLDQDTVLGVLLYRAGKVTKDQLTESLMMMEEQGIRQGEALIQMGVLNFPQLVLVLQKQVEIILQKVMRLREGAWAFFELDDLPERFVTPPLRVPAIIFRALVKHCKELSIEDVAEAHRKNMDRYVFLAEGIAEIVPEMQFASAEKKFIEILGSNSWRLRELFSVSNLARTETAAVVWALNELEFLDYRQEETHERYLQRVGTRIKQKVSQLRVSTHFDVLEIHWICLPEEVREAHERIRHEFAPSTYHDLTPDLLRDLERINAAIEGAWRTLSDDRQRRSYREEVIEKDKIVQSAEILAKKGEMAILKGDRRDALTCWGKASELVPTRVEFSQGLARARTL